MSYIKRNRGEIGVVNDMVNLIESRQSAVSKMSNITTSTSVSAGNGSPSSLNNNTGLEAGDGIKITPPDATTQKTKIANTGILSISADGKTKITGDATLSEGTNIKFTQVDKDIKVDATGAAVPDGTTDDDILVWDQTTDKKWEVAKLTDKAVDLLKTQTIKGLKHFFDQLYADYGLFAKNVVAVDNVDEKSDIVYFQVTYTIADPYKYYIGYVGINKKTGSLYFDSGGSVENLSFQIAGTEYLNISKTVSTFAKKIKIQSKVGADFCEYSENSLDATRDGSGLEHVYNLKLAGETVLSLTYPYTGTVTATFTGIVKGEEPSADDDLATKYYVDNAISGTTGTSACIVYHFDYPSDLEINLGAFTADKAKTVFTFTHYMPRGFYLRVQNNTGVDKFRCNVTLYGIDVNGIAQTEVFDTGEIGIGSAVVIDGVKVFLKVTYYEITKTGGSWGGTGIDVSLFFSTLTALPNNPTNLLNYKQYLVDAMPNVILGANSILDLDKIDVGDIWTFFVN